MRIAPDARRVSALVQGQGPMPYRTAVVRAEGSRTGWVGACTCPVGEDCKHAVAVLLTLRGRLPGGLARTDARRSRTWEEELADLVSAAEPAQQTSVPLGLQFDLVAPEPGRGRASAGAGRSCWSPCP